MNLVKKFSRCARYYLTLVVVLAAATGMLVQAQQMRSAAAMADSANRFLASLTPIQKGTATFDFSNEGERTGWHFIPAPRRGIPIKDLTEAQRKLAMDLLKTGFGVTGYQKATLIMSLENVLKELERRNNPTGGMTRDPELYYFTVFGTPSPKNTWGWRFEGHHVSINMTVVKGTYISGTPLFLGANPREVKDGERKGLRVLANEEDEARALVQSLDAGQLKVAVIDPVAPKDILTYNLRRADPLISPGRQDAIYRTGLTVSEMTDTQRKLLKDLVDVYLSRMPADVAAERSQKLQASDFTKVAFAWAGGIERDQPHYYRVQGPTFLIEYDCTQNNANHTHSVWRDFNGDFGADLLAQHYYLTRH